MTAISIISIWLQSIFWFIARRFSTAIKWSLKRNRKHYITNKAAIESDNLAQIVRAVAVLVAFCFFEMPKANKTYLIHEIRIFMAPKRSVSEHMGISVCLPNREKIITFQLWILFHTYGAIDFEWLNNVVLPFIFNVELDALTDFALAKI